MIQIYLRNMTGADTDLTALLFFFACYDDNGSTRDVSGPLSPQVKWHAGKHLRPGGADVISVRVTLGSLACR